MFDNTVWEAQTADSRFDLRVASQVTSVPIRQDFIPQGRNNRPGYPLTVSFITIHDTANPNAGADAANHATYLKSDTAANIPASWHFTVDDGEIYQHLPLSENGWHAGDGGAGTGNRQSIGIEICENSDGNRPQAEENAAWLTAKLLRDYNLSISAVKQHNYWSQTKDCPHILRARAGGWDEFLAKVTSYALGASTINNVTFSPATGAAKIAGSALNVEVSVDLTPASTGYLQVTMSVPGGGSPTFTSGVKIISTSRGNRVVDLMVTSATKETKDYHTFVQFRPGANGPLTDVQPGDTTATFNNYSIRWVECFDATVTVQANPDNGGTASGTGNYSPGSQQTISASPNSGSGYVFKNWNDGVTQNPRTITAVCGGSTYVANFERQAITITASAGNGGTIEPNGAFNKNAGESQLFTASPNANYAVNQWLVDSAVVRTGGNSFTLSNIQANRSVQVTFVPVGSVGFVQRQLPLGYAPGTPFTVKLEAIPVGNALAYGVEDQPPAGWTVSAINESGAYDSVNKKVKWTFLDGNSRTLSYQVTPPANATGNQSFQGTGNLNGTDSSAIGGMTTIDLAAYHPADVNPSNWSLPLGEVLTYATGYKRGDSWNVGPNPIPLGHVIRGFLLYKSGERYRFDTSVASAPGWWVSYVGPALSAIWPASVSSAAQVLAAPATLNNSAVSELPPQYSPGVAFTVTILVKPSAGTFAYGVEDQPPSGWTVSGISENGAFDAANWKVKWTFLDNAPRTLSYQVTAPVAASGPVLFSGIANFDGVSESAISGQRSSMSSVISPLYTLTVAAVNGSVAKSPDQPNYSSGSSVTLTASPTAGFQFGGWSGDAGGKSNPLVLTMNGNKSISATFVPVVPTLPQLIEPTLTSGVFGFTLIGEAGGNCIVEFSMDLQSWVPFSTYTLPASGRLVIADAMKSGQSHFFRAKVGIPSDMIWLPPGKFAMGSPEGEAGRYAAEGPETQVQLTSGVWMSSHEVTQRQFLEVMGWNPSAHVGDLNRPVEQVTWEDALAYCAAVTAKERAAGRLPFGHSYRLPTEAEWEYACRAGSTSPFSFGSELRSGMVNFCGTHEYIVGQADHLNSSGICLGITAVVSSFAPNAWGLYDMHGNVWEWCQDWYGDRLPGGSVTDPKGPASGSRHVIRGGSYANSGSDCRSAARFILYPRASAVDYGFRVVLAVEPL